LAREAETIRLSKAHFYFRPEIIKSVFADERPSLKRHVYFIGVRNGYEDLKPVDLYSISFVIIRIIAST
jgi:hypothetical protein